MWRTHAKESINTKDDPSHKLPYNLPVIVRSSLAAAYAHVRRLVEQTAPTLARQLGSHFQRHMHAVLLDDLPLGSATALLNYSIRSYHYLTPDAFMHTISEMNPVVHAQGFEAALDWLLEPPLQGMAGRKRRWEFTTLFAKREARYGPVRVRRDDGAPLRVRDWVRGLIEGRDLLSDAGSNFNSSVPVFKAMGAWSVGPNGEVYLENTDGDFENIWIQPDGRLLQTLDVNDAITRFKTYLRQLEPILS